MTDLLLALVMLLNFVLLGSGRIQVLIRAVAVQGMALAALPLTAGHAGEGLGLLIRSGILTAVAFTVKGFVVPYLLLRAFSQLRIKREVEPYIGFVSSLLLGAAGTGFALLIGHSLPLAGAHANGLVVPASLATLFTGFLILITRRKAVTQAAGYLVLENGIAVFGLLVVAQVPFLVETSLLLDLVAGVFVMVIVMGHIQREFTTMDTRHLTNLKE